MGNKMLYDFSLAPCRGIYAVDKDAKQKAGAKAPAANIKALKDPYKFPVTNL